MTDAQLVGLVLIAAMASPLLLLIPVLREYRAVCREWAALTETVDALRADIDADPLADMPCLDAAAAVLVAELMPEIAAWLEESR